MNVKKGIRKILGRAARFLCTWTLALSLTLALFPSHRDFSTVRAQKCFSEPAKRVEIKEPKRRYAFLIKGGDLCLLPMRNWAVNNIAHGYEALKKIGYTDEDIVVFSSKKIKLNGKDIVDYKVNKGASSCHVLYDAFDDLSRKVGPEDSLFVFFSGHGGKGGDLMLEERVAIPASELENLLSQVKPLYSVVLINSCFSGDAAHKIGKNSIIAISDSRRGKVISMLGKFPESVFSAVAGNKEADYDKNGKISVEEVFDYATANNPTCRQVKSLSDILAYIGRHYTLRFKITPQLVYQNANPAEVYLAEEAK